MPQLPRRAALVFAWGGGAAFVLSLGALVGLYAVRLAPHAPGQRGSVPGAAWNAAVFSIFALHHSLMARARARRIVTAIVPEPLERSIYVWTSSLLALIVCLAWTPHTTLLYRLDGPAAWTAAAVQLAGAYLTARAAALLDPLELAGIRQALEAWTSPPNRVHKAGHGRSDLSWGGPYGLVRHPIYLGWMLMVFAAPAMTVGRLEFAIVSTAYLLIAIPWEERALVRRHGDAYEAYRRAVRWRVIPGLY